jgi:hypothetical protein
MTSNKTAQNFYSIKPEHAGALSQFIARGDRDEHPDGEFDQAKRWYPKEACGPLCHGYRSPSRAFPFSALLHCRTAAHVAGLYTSDADAAGSIVAACRSKQAQQRDYAAIIQRFPPRRRSAAAAAMLAALPMPVSLSAALDGPSLYLCEAASAGKPSAANKSKIQAWIEGMLSTFTQAKCAADQWGRLARLHVKLGEFGARVGINYQCPPDLLAHAL